MSNRPKVKVVCENLTPGLVRWLTAELARIEVTDDDPGCLLALGQEALDRLMPGAKLPDVRGALLQCGNLPLIASWHPRQVYQQPLAGLFFRADVAKAARIAQGRSDPLRLDYVQTSSADEAEAWFAACGEPVAVDIEVFRSCVIDTIGFHDGRTGLSVDASRPTSELLRVLTRFLTGPKRKVFHNGQYDVQMIARVWGIGVQNWAGDTMILHHSLYPEVPKDLGTLASLYLDLPPWKTMSSSRHEYNMYDVLSTIRLHQLFEPNDVYRAQMTLMAPCLAVGQRGIRVDREAVAQLKAELSAEPNVDGVNPNSPKQVLAKLRERGIPAKDTSAKTLAAYAEDEFVQAVLAYRERAKLAQFIANVGDRVRFTLRPGGTETFRFSSTKTPWGEGLNIQTIPKRIRRIFIPDSGMKMGYADQKQAESRVVAWLSRDPGLIQAHEKSDPHEAVTRMIWPDVEDVRDVAFRHWTYRDLGKRAAHAMNYGAGPHSLCRNLHIPLRLAEDVYRRYFQAFPGVRDWQMRIRAQLRSKGTITFPFGEFHVARPWNSDETWRHALSAIPQAIVAWTNHIVFFRAWRMESEAFQVLAHVHDAILFQYREAMPPLDFRVVWDGGLVIPYECHLGGNNWYEVS